MKIVQKTLYETWIKDNGRWRRWGFRLRAKHLADRQTDSRIKEGIEAKTRVYVPDAEHQTLLNEFGGGLPEDKWGI